MGKQRVVKTLPRSSWLEIFAEASVRDTAMYYLMYYLGMRVGEVCYLRFADVDIDGGKILTPPEGKSGQRILGMPESPRFFHALESWLDERSKLDFAGRYFFCTSKGTRVNEANVRAALRTNATKAGYSGIHPHMMRHSCATELLELDKVGLRTVSDILGHADTVITSRTYSHSIQGLAQETMRQRII